MTTAEPGIRRLHHVAILTRSIERSMDHWVGLLRVERPHNRDVDKPGMKLRTSMVPAGPDADTFIQLIEPEIGPGVAELERHGDGAIFEVAFEVADIEDAAAAYRVREHRPARPARPPYRHDPISSRHPVPGTSTCRWTPTLGPARRSCSLSPQRRAAPNRSSASSRAAWPLVPVVPPVSAPRWSVTWWNPEPGSPSSTSSWRLLRRWQTGLGGPGPEYRIAGDVTDADEVRRVVAEVIATFGTVDIVVNCAGLNRFVAPEAVDDALWRKLLGINLDGPWNVCSAVMPEMIRRRTGRIVNISSAAGVLGIPKAVPYSTAKHGVVGLTRALAVDLGPYEINVNCVAPGTTLTPS